MATFAKNLSMSVTPVITRIEQARNLLELRLRDVWNYRELLFFLGWRNLKVRYKQTVIGVVWVVIQPLLSMAVFTIFFGRLAKLPSDGLPYPVFYFSALVPWSYSATAIQTTTNTVVDNQRVITKFYFPHLILPLSSVISGLVDCKWVCRPRFRDDVPSHRTWRSGPVGALVPNAGASHSTWCWSLAFCTQRALQRCPACNDIFRSILDAGISRRLSE
jgi:hypothetical protein